MPARISSTALPGARYRSASRYSRRGQRSSVEFAVGRQRQRRNHHHRGGHHVGRQSLGQCGAHLYRVGAAGDVTDQSFVSGAVFAGDHDRLLHPVQGGQGGLNFAEFDAVPADLDLLVGAAEVLQLPIGAPAHQVAGAIHPRARLVERACHEPRPGQGRAPTYPTRHRRRPRTTRRPHRRAPAATTCRARTTRHRAPASRWAPHPSPPAAAH